MDVRAEPHRTSTRAGLHLLLERSGGERPPSRARVGEALGEWQAAEVASAWRYPQCRGLSRAQLEDLYQETVLALLNRPFCSEEHLRNALRVGLRNRALHVHRDERRRSEILTAHAPEAHRSAMRASESEQPEHATLAREDGLIVLEFASGLTELEQQVYALEAEGLRYRAIAPILAISVNQARKASRILAEKYARFQLLHDTGRLCGFRAPTIRALIAGEEASEQLARAAFAHLRSCARCRDEHKTNAARLRRSFQQRAAAFLPLPALLEHERTRSLWLRARLLAHRFLASGAPSGGGGVRERALALAATGGAGVKVATGVATVVAVAGGTFTVGAAAHHTRHHRTRPRAASAASTLAPEATPLAAVASAATAPEPAVRLQRHTTSRPAPAHEPGGFAYLGVAASGSGSERASAASAPPRSARIAQAGEASSPPSEQGTTHAEGGYPQHGGGPFSP